MILYILRHAHAEDTPNMPDERRALTEKGRASATALARWLARDETDLHALYTSPRVRAAQTAQIVGEALGMKPTVTDVLDFGFMVKGLENLLKGVQPAHSVMLVGHEPTLSACIRDLTGAQVQMKKCGLARIDLASLRSPYRGELVWLVPPKVVRGLMDAGE